MQLLTANRKINNLLFIDLRAIRFCEVVFGLNSPNVVHYPLSFIMHLQQMYGKKSCQKTGAKQFCFQLLRKMVRHAVIIIDESVS